MVGNVVYEEGGRALSRKGLSTWPRSGYSNVLGSGDLRYGYKNAALDIVARVNAVSFIHQTARPAVSHLGACFSRAATRSRSMWSSIAVGWVS